MVDLSRPLDLHDPGAGEFLRGIQGNILKGHGRRHAANLLLEMTGSPDDVRHWVARFAAHRVTTAAAALDGAARYRGHGGPGEPFAMVLLSAAGYRYLGVADDALPTTVDPIRAAVGNRQFRTGMKGANPPDQPSGIGNDPPSSRWEEPYRAPVHLMLLLADDDRDRLDATVREVGDAAAPVFRVLTVERGDELKRTFPRGTVTIEHFGFQDGISQPILVQQDLDAELAARGGTHWNPGAPLSLAFVREPGGGYGSFAVFRKLEQDVRAFTTAMDGLRTLLGSAAPGQGADDAGALVVGRHPDGLPAVPAAPVHAGAEHNDFDFAADTDGALCPFASHIRKTNPRGDIGRERGARLAEFERSRRIVRRGITYGERPDLAEGAAAGPPGEGVGLLFLCFQSNLDQFKIQQDGSDGNDFVHQGVGVDALIGTNPAPTAQTWPGGATFTMTDFVRMRGGEYFFAPSIPYLTGGMPS